MKNSEQNSATSSGVQALPTCFACNKPIANKVWFRRRLEKTEGGAGSQAVEVLLCSPTCALRYFGNSQTGGKSFEPNYDGYEHSLHIPKDQKIPNAKRTKSGGREQ